MEIDADRLWARLMKLGRFGALPEGGVNRQALSAEEVAARRCLIGWAEEAGLEPSTDPAGNLFLTLMGRDPELPPVLTGSHIDSQPTGGLFDGTLGTIAALEAATVIAGSGLTPRRSIVVVAWMNEEGSRFAPGMMGSELFAGSRDLNWVRQIRDADGISVGAALDAMRQAFRGVRERPLGFPFHAYIEAHIEQADRLETEGITIGAVTGIQGKQTYRVSLTGREAHAGTEPMPRRQDALQAFIRIAAQLQAHAESDREAMFTIGRIELRPNAPSVVPAKVTFSIDYRHPSNDRLAEFDTHLDDVLAAAAVPFTIERLVRAPSNDFDPDLRGRILSAARARDLPAIEMLSLAGHDARHLSGIGRAALIFTPCRGGVSHHPDEWAEPRDVAAGAAVLLDVIADLAEPS